jgi:hypothetical protein
MFHTSPDLLVTGFEIVIWRSYRSRNNRAASTAEREAVNVAETSRVAEASRTAN